MISSENRRILVIDDNPAIHEDFRKILAPQPGDTASLDEKERVIFGCPQRPQPRRPFQIDSAFQGEQGLAMIRQARLDGQPYTMAFVDIRMPPGWDGVETVQRVRSVDPEIQIVLCTAYSDYTLDDIVSRFGETDCLLFIRKPFDAMSAHLLTIALAEKWRISRQMAGFMEHQNDCIVNLERVMSLIEQENSTLESSNDELEKQSNELSRRLQQRTIEILGTRDVTVFALAQLAESRDPETGDHLKRMRDYAQLLAEHLALKGPYVEQIDEVFLGDFYRSTPLHDIGKVGIPDQILLKPGPLAPNEFEIMKRHTLIGAEALKKAAGHSPFGSFLSMAADITRYHHERFDGTGYPIGLKGEQIPLSARIASLADVFDALTSRRVYRDAISTQEAKKMIESNVALHFDPVVVHAFQERFDDFLQVKSDIDGQCHPCDQSQDEIAWSSAS